MTDAPSNQICSQGIRHVPIAVVADDAEERLLKRRKLLADIEAVEAATQERQRLLPIKVATETQALLEGFAVSPHLSAIGRQILHDYTLNNVLVADQCWKAPGQRTVNEFLQDLPVSCPGSSA